MALTVLFDDRCGKCRRFVRLSSALDFAGQLDVVGLSDPRIAREFSHFDLEALNFEMHVINFAGARVSGLLRDPPHCAGGAVDVAAGGAALLAGCFGGRRADLGLDRPEPIRQSRTHPV